MPSLNPGVPDVLPGGADIYSKALVWSGQAWMLPSALAYVSTVVIANDLVSGPPPVTPLFTPEDLEASLIPYNFLNATELNPRQWDLVRAYLYAQNVVATPGDPPTPPTDPMDPPAGYVEPVPPDADTDNVPWLVKKLLAMEDRIRWLQQQATPRQFLVGFPKTISGSGSVGWDTNQGGNDEYSTTPMGFRITVTLIPEWIGRSGGPPPTIFYRMGELSWNKSGWMGSPIHLNRDHLLIYPIVADWPELAYNLPDGVEAQVFPLYPTQLGGDTPD